MPTTICMHKFFSVFDEGNRAFTLFQEKPRAGIQWSTALQSAGVWVLLYVVPVAQLRLDTYN